MLGKPPKTSVDVTFIAAACQIEGTVHIKGDARIDGKLEGLLQATGDIVIGQGAYVKANIEAKTVSIAGEVHGSVQTSETLQLSSSARLYGDICSKQFSVEQGARFVGNSQLFDATAQVPPHAQTSAPVVDTAQSSAQAQVPASLQSVKETQNTGHTPRRR